MFSSKSIAYKIAQLCDPKKVYVTVNHHHKGFPDKYVIRVYGSNPNGVMGIWGLLTDEEVGSLEVGVHRFYGGGLLLDKAHAKYHTVQALVVNLWRMLGHEGYPDVQYL